MRNRTVVILVAVLLGWVATAGAGDTLESVEKKLTEKSKTVKALTADVSMVTDMAFPGGSSKSKSTGTLEFLKKGDMFLSRMEINTVSTQKYGEQETKMESSTQTILDGEFAYVLADQMGQKMAMKQKADNMQGADAETMFRTLRKDHDLKLLPDSTVDGQAVYVIEATPKSAATGAGKSVSYFAKDSGLVVKMVNFNPQGQPMSEMTYTSIKVNPKIDPDRFVFKAPAGVQVMDMTTQ